MIHARDHSSASRPALSLNSSGILLWEQFNKATLPVPDLRMLRALLTRVFAAL